MSELDEIMDGKYEMRGFRIEGDTIGFDTPQSCGWNLSPRDIEIIIYTLQKEIERYKNITDEAIKELETLLPLCIMPNNTLIHATEKSKTINKTLKILKGE